MNAVAPATLETPRLLLRPWRTTDKEPFAAINADPEVMRYVTGRPSTREESDASVDGYIARWADEGHGRYAVEERATGALIGFIGLGPHSVLPGEVEIGWRLARSAWGQGFATEGALAVRDVAFSVRGLSSLISVIAVDNLASARVATKLGLTLWREQDFEQRRIRIFRLDADSVRGK